MYNIHIFKYKTILAHPKKGLNPEKFKLYRVNLDEIYKKLYIFLKFPSI